jgi:sulfatase modifying factor 1
MRAVVVVGALVVAVAACGGGGETADVDAGTGDGGGDSLVGTWDNPIVIDALPFAIDGTTVDAPETRVTSYDCAPSIGEGGAEVVYRLDLDASAIVAIDLTGIAADVDVDVHVLRAPMVDCIARDDRALVADLAPGSWWIAVDTYSDVNPPKPGAYHLTIDTPHSMACLTNPIPACAAGDTPDVNGIVQEPAGMGGCPPGMAPSGGVCVDRWEAALVLDEGKVIAGWSPYANPGTRRVRAVSAPGIVPQGYINGVQAGAACAVAGKRLCTDTEWLRACQGATGTTYPYGSTRENGRCNDARTCHPAVQYFESSDQSVFSMIGHACLDQLPDGLARTGAYQGCATADGIMDMMGNLHEWTADPAGTFRGGFFVDTRINGEGCLYRTTAHDTSHWDYSTGFRCCADLP